MLLASVLCSISANATTITLDDKAPPSDTLSVSRLEADAKGNPKVKEDFKTLQIPGGKENAVEKDSVTIPKTSYYFFESKVVGNRTFRGASDTWYFDEFKVHFYSDVLPDKLEEDLKKIPDLLTAQYFEGGSKLDVTVPLVRMSMFSGNAREALDAESDTFKIQSFTSKDGNIYSKDQTLTGKEELTKGLGGTIPTQAIEIMEDGKLSDVVVIDPITFHFESDSDELLDIPGGNAIKFDLNTERFTDTTVFAARISSDTNVPEPGTLGLVAIGLIALAWIGIGVGNRASAL